jgi:putative transposase
MCRVLDVSRSGYYAWRRRGESFRAKANRGLVERIRAVHTRSRQTYGSPRVHVDLREEGIVCGRHRVARLMRTGRIQGLRRRHPKRATGTTHGRLGAENLLGQQFYVKRPNQVWAGDITTLWTGSGWLYLAVVMDLYSRSIIGWAMSNRMTEQIAMDALTMALERRRPSEGLLHHSDQGSQYASERFQRLLTEHGIRCSMSRKGNCYDNACVESFFSTLKTELTRRHRYATREEARAEIFEYIEAFYNRQRRHSTLGYKAPAEYELMNGVA